MRKIDQLDNVLKYNGTLSFQQGLIYRKFWPFQNGLCENFIKAQKVEEQKRANRRKDLERNKHRVPDGVADFEQFQPHMPNILWFR